MADEPSKSNGDLVAKRRRSHHSSGERSGRERESTHSPTSPRRLLRLLTEEEHQSSQLRQLLSTAFDQIESTNQRAIDSERLAYEASERLNDVKLSAEEEVSRSSREISLYRLQLENANREIAGMKDRLRIVESQRDDAETAAARARTTARKLNEERLIQLAREEGRRVGFEAGFLRGQRQALADTRTVAFQDTRPDLPVSRSSNQGLSSHQQDALTNDAVSDRSASPSALPIRSLPMDSPISARPAVILETDFRGRNSTETGLSRPTTGDDQRQLQGAYLPSNHPPEDAFQSRRIAGPSRIPGRMSLSKTPPMEIFQLDIPPQHELELEQPPPSPHTPTIPLPPILPETDVSFYNPSQIDHPIPPRGGKFEFLTRRMKHLRHPSNDTSSTGMFQGDLDDPSNTSETNGNALGIVSEDPITGTSFTVPNHPDHLGESLASGIPHSDTQSGGMQTISMIPRRVSKIIKKLAGSMERGNRRHSAALSISARSHRSALSSPGTPPDITIEPPSRSPTDSSSRPDIISVHLLSPDHTMSSLPPVIPDARLYSSDTVNSHSPRISSLNEYSSSVDPPDGWLPPGFVPDGPPTPSMDHHAQL